VSIGLPDAEGLRDVIMELNGERWFVKIHDTSAVADGDRREKAGVAVGEIGSPMPGVVVDLKVKTGDVVKEGEPLAVLSAMKMESSIPAPCSGTVQRVLVTAGDKVEGDDLMLVIE